MIKINCYEDNKLVEEKSINFDNHKKEEAFLFMHNKNLGLRYVTGSYYFLDSPGLYLAEYTNFIGDISEIPSYNRMSVIEKTKKISEYFKLVKGRMAFIVGLRTEAYYFIEQEYPKMPQREKCKFLDISRAAYAQYPIKVSKTFLDLIGDDFNKIISDKLVLKSRPTSFLKYDEKGELVNKRDPRYYWTKYEE